MVSPRSRPTRSRTRRPGRLALILGLGLALVAAGWPAGAAAPGPAALQADPGGFFWDQPAYRIGPAAAAMAAAKKPTAGYDLVGSSIRMVGALGVVLGLIVLVLWVARRFFTQRPLMAGGQSISVVAARHIAPKKQIMIVEIEGQKLVLGLSGDSITYLTRLPAAEDEPAED
jgi:flagellar biosynthetic protein FliO